MAHYQDGCGGPGLMSWTTNTAASTGVYCKVNSGKYSSTITVNTNLQFMANLWCQLVKKDINKLYTILKCNEV